MLLMPGPRPLAELSPLPPSLSEKRRTDDAADAGPLAEFSTPPTPLPPPLSEKRWTDDAADARPSSVG